MMSENTLTERSTDVRQMLSVKQVLAQVRFIRATLYREMEAKRFPSAHAAEPHRLVG